MDRPILAEPESAPGWYGRYRFYTAGKVPPGYDEWAHRRLSLWRFPAVYVALDVAAWGSTCLMVLAVSGGFTNPWGTWILLAGAIAIAPFSAAYYRNKARRSLAPPSAHAVLKEIGEGRLR